MPLDSSASRSIDRSSNTTTSSISTNTTSSSSLPSGRTLLKRAKSNKDLLTMYSRERTVPEAPPVPPLVRDPSGRPKSSVSTKVNPNIIESTSTGDSRGAPTGNTTRTTKTLRTSKSFASLRVTKNDTSTDLAFKKDQPSRADLSLSRSEASSGSSSLISFEMSVGRSTASRAGNDKGRGKGKTRDERAFCLADLEAVRTGRQSNTKAHLRYRPEIPRIPVIPSIQVEPSLQETAQQISSAIRILLPTDEHRSTDGHIPLVPSFRYATNLSPHGLSVSLPTRPDGFVLPSSLLTPSQRADSRPWLADTIKYGSSTTPRHSTGSQLPDLFSRAHHIASSSNGRMMVVTLYRDLPIQSNHCSDALGKTKVYVSPGLAVDLAPLGKAALEFRERFDHLLAPVTEWYHQEERSRRDTGKTSASAMEREGLVVLDGVTDVDQYKKPEAWNALLEKQDTFGGIEGKARNGIEVPLLPPEALDPPSKVQESRCQDPSTEQTLTPTEVQFLASHASRAVDFLEPLAPGCHDRFSKYNSIFHTYEPSSVQLYDEARDHHVSVAAAPDKRKDAGHDMRYVTARTGGLGATFVFETNSQTGHVSATVHTSWHFWTRHRHGLMHINAMIYEAVRPSLLLSEVIKRKLRTSAYRLTSSPFNQGEWSRDESPEVENWQMLHYRFRIALPQSIWIGYPDTENSRSEDDKAKRFIHGAIYRHQHDNSSACPATALPHQSVPPAYRPDWERSYHQHGSPVSTTSSSPPPSPPLPVETIDTPTGRILKFAVKPRIDPLIYKTVRQVGSK